MRTEQIMYSHLDDTSLHTAHWDSSNATNLVHILQMPHQCLTKVRNNV